VAGTVAALAALCAALCGAVPAWLASRRAVVDVLRRGVTPAPRELAFRRVLVTGEVALAFVLLVCVTLLGGSLRRILAVNPGFDADGVLAMHVSIPAAAYPTLERVTSFYDALQRALEDRLGSRTVSIVNEVPLTGDGGRRVVSTRRNGPGPEAVQRETGPAYFEVMRIPIVDGRSFDSRDGASAGPRVIVSAALAARLFAGASPIGRQVWVAGDIAEAEIVGVAADVKHRSLDEANTPTLYRAASQTASRSSVVVARSTRPDVEVIAIVREEVARLDSSLPVYGTRSMLDVLAASPGVPARRVLIATFTIFSVLAVSLGAIGLFGVVAHDVARRRSELALRIALGAGTGRILRATLAQGAMMVGLGLAAGALLSLWAARAIASLLFGTGATDLLTIGVAALSLGAAGLAAVLPAALRAARTDPLSALRAE
jgi:predicted permease